MSPSEADATLTDGRYDFVIIGSGFGGSVCALRLSEKGYRVLVIEEGKCWLPADFPRTSWNVRKYLWLPRLGCTGIQACGSSMVP
jgi:cholesterol oxidase